MFETLPTGDDTPRTRFVVYAQAETDVTDQFGTRNVAVDQQRLPSGSSEPFVVIQDDGEFAGAVGLGTLQTLLEPPIRRPGAMEDLPACYRALYDVLDDTVFTGLNRRQLLATSREFEDCALRVGHGTLRVSFQSLSAFEAQVPVYRHLAGRTDLGVHIYGRPDWWPPEFEGVTYHRTSDDTVSRHWVLAFDGGGDEGQACALVARQTGGEFTGYWSYDHGRVSGLRSELQAFDR